MNIQKYLLLWQKFPRLTLLIWTIPLLILNGFNASLLPHDEGYYAIQARWMWESGDWLTPQFWAEPIYDRTIGLQWSIALAYHLFGLNEFSARLPGVIFCVAGVILTYEIGKLLFDRQIAWLGAAILMLMALWVNEAHLAQQNTGLVAFELLGIWALLKLTDSNSIDRQTNRYWGMVGGIAIGWGFLIKGFMIIIPLVAILPYIIWRRYYRQLLSNLGIYLGLIIGATPTLLWLGLSCQKYGGLMPVRDLFTKLLFLSNTNVYNPSPVYYFWNLPANIFPWALFSIVGAVVLWRKLLPQLNYSAIGISLGYPLAMFTLLSLFRTRMPYYMLQLLPFMALLAATAFVWFARAGRLPHSRWHRGVTYLGYAFSGLGVLLTIAGAIVISTNSLLGLTIAPEIRRYGIPAMVLGMGWSMISLCWHRWQLGKTPYWLISWLLPAWLTFIILGSQGAFIDKSPEFRVAFAQLRTLPEIAQQPVYLLNDSLGDSRASEIDFFTQMPSHFQPPLSEEEHKSLVLLSFYTPHLGRKVDKFADLPNLAYAWKRSNASDPKPDRVRIVAYLKEWQIIQKVD
jgi:4-amino-4-deoxy-L-arabinose transferase-like glycosyltransferase